MKAKVHKDNLGGSAGRRLHRRRGIRCLVVALVAIMVIDASPPQTPGLGRIRPYLSQAVKRVGLWQGEWTLFAPNPKLNNSWLSAELEQIDAGSEGELGSGSERNIEYWNSTYWPDTNAWEKFVGFRRMNYNIRVPLQNELVRADFSDYLARQMISPHARYIPPETSGLEGGWQVDSEVDAVVPENSQAEPSELYRLSVFQNALNISMPPDGTLPSREDTLWLTTSKNLTIREYRP